MCLAVELAGCSGRFPQLAHPCGVSLEPPGRAISQNRFSRGARTLRGLSGVCRRVSDALKPLIVGSPDEPECGDEGRESGGLLLASRVGQEEAGERWTPILEHADQRSTLEVFGDAILRDPREARSVKRSLNHETRGPALHSRGVP